MATAQAAPVSPKPPKARHPLWARLLLWMLDLFIVIGVVEALLPGYTLLVATPNLPSLDVITDYRPKIPLRVYTADNVLIGEFGEERRSFVPITQMPGVMKRAVLAIEDDHFYERGGVDFIGVLRAGLTNLHGGLSRGAPIITMQVVRNFFLSSEKMYTRKIYEILLSYKIEASLTKDQIFKLYMNQIYPGQRACGFVSAEQIYFSKNIKDITLARAAMLTGLPRAPSAYNPVVNPKRARVRQEYILQYMRDPHCITPEQYTQAVNEQLPVRGEGHEFDVHAEYVAEMMRQLIYAQYREEAYTRGLNVYTTLRKSDQDMAYQSVRRGILDYECRHGYRGPEAFIDLPSDAEEREQAIDDALLEHPNSDDLQSAMVVSVISKLVHATMLTGETIDLVDDGLRFAQAALSNNAQPKIKLRPDAVIRVIEDTKMQKWSITQLPEVASGFISLDPQTGAIYSMVSGFDFNRSKFNHVTQAWRQPGLSFKPFIYSAAANEGFSPSTVINDAPFSIPTGDTGNRVWEPKNYGGGCDGPMMMRRALQKSRNLVSVRILRAIGTQYAQQYITRFGFDADRHPAYLPMVLGAGFVTMLQMASGYSVFVNGDYRVSPYIIGRVVDVHGTAVQRSHPMTAGKDAVYVIDPRNDFIMDSLLRSVVLSGTGYQAKVKLGRNDMTGKTGTTDDSFDAWFCGYTPKLVDVTWMGCGNSRSLGDHETGGGLALPIWINYMSYALKGEPQTKRWPPEGVVQTAGDWAYEEYANGQDVASVGLGDAMPGVSAPGGDQPQQLGINLAPAQEQEKQKILDMFRGN